MIAPPASIPIFSQIPIFTPVTPFKPASSEGPSGNPTFPTRFQGPGQNSQWQKRGGEY